MTTASEMLKIHFLLALFAQPVFQQTLDLVPTQETLPTGKFMFPFI
jgi:hypothetical protein